MMHQISKFSRVDPEASRNKAFLVHHWLRNSQKLDKFLRQLYFVVFSFDINILSSFQAPLNLFQEVLIELEQKFPNCLDFWGGLPLMSRHTIFLSRRKSREDNLYYLCRCLHCLHAAAHGPSNPRMSTLSGDKWHKLNDYAEALLSRGAGGQMASTWQLPGSWGSHPAAGCLVVSTDARAFCG